MDVNEIKSGMKVRVVKLGSTMGMLIHDKHLKIREVGKEGTITNWIPGHGGDVWGVLQDNGLACYCFDEIEAVEQSLHPTSGIRRGLLASLWLRVLSARKHFTIPPTRG